ncbi:YnbE family lipoprotein [Pseudomonas aeruginosa]|uniref:YnbE family lipoprotein n=1 Tax=Pseudomonas aeruginosa TaxID=287 RepID=UPI003969A6F8
MVVSVAADGQHNADLTMACTPTVQLAAPSEPININLNVKIEHEIYIKVDKALDGIINENSGLF